jgi:hypothetical protein
MGSSVFRWRAFPIKPQNLQINPDNMKFSSSCGIAFAYLSICHVALGGPAPVGKPFSYPGWWFERDVIPQINSNVPAVWPGDYPPTSHLSPVLLGQLKHIATAAYDECVAKLPPSAWTSTEGLALTGVVGAFTQNDNKAIANLGQLKNVASVFYDLLNAQGVDVSAITGADPYPWSDDVLDDSNTSPATLGQLKHVFSFFNETTFQSFDYAVIRYIWDAGNGRDLDTRTQVYQPDVSGQGGTPPTDYAVGWSRASTQSGPAGNYVEWGGDNTGNFGPEAVLLDFPNLTADYSSTNQFDISLNAFWYGASVDKKVRVQFQTYSGGTMTRSGFDWVNTGGVQVDNYFFDVTLTTNGVGNDIDGEHVGYIHYNALTKEAVLTK